MDREKTYDLLNEIFGVFVGGILALRAFALAEKLEDLLREWTEKLYVPEFDFFDRVGFTLDIFRAILPDLVDIALGLFVATVFILLIMSIGKLRPITDPEVSLKTVVSQNKTIIVAWIIFMGVTHCGFLFLFLNYDFRAFTTLLTVYYGLAIWLGMRLVVLAYYDRFLDD